MVRALEISRSAPKKQSRSAKTQIEAKAVRFRTLIFSTILSKSLKLCLWKAQADAVSGVQPAFVFPEQLIVQPTVSAHFIKVVDHGVELLVQSLDARLHGFPDWARLK